MKSQTPVLGRTGDNGRRNFLKVSLGMLASVVSGVPQVRAEVIKPQRKVRAGVQLYSVRKLCEQDFPGTLRALKAMGYEGVQCGGFFGRTAKELNTLFKDHGLAAAGMQMQADRIIKPENLSASVTFASELGAPYLFVPWFDAKTADGWKRFAEQMSVAAQAFKAAGIGLGYHNHQHEFRDRFDGVCKWDILYQNASPDVLQQLDLGHCLLAGESPAFWLKKYPNRNPAVHVKAASKTTGVIGADGADWEKVFAACEADVTEWYVVEAEVRPDTLDDVRDCLAYMKKLGRA
jgi:sugar phosphate isomerase/epimerase